MKTRVGNTVGNLFAFFESQDSLQQVRFENYDGELLNFDIKENEDGVLVIFPYVDDEE